MKCTTCDKAEDEEIKLKKCAVCQTAFYCSTECQRNDWSSHKAACTKAGCLQLITAVREKDSDTVTRLAKTKRVLNGRVDYAPPSTSSGDYGDTPGTMEQWTALHECVRQENTELMKILLDNGANVEIKDADGDTATFVASTSGNPQLVKMLLDAGANPNSCSNDGWSCLMMATRAGDYEVTKALLEGGADLRFGHDMFGRNALDIATVQAGGQGVHSREDWSYEEAVENAKRIQALLG